MEEAVYKGSPWQSGRSTQPMWGLWEATRRDRLGETALSSREVGPQRQDHRRLGDSQKGLPLLADNRWPLLSPDRGARRRARRPLEGTPAPHTATASLLREPTHRTERSVQVICKGLPDPFEGSHFPRVHNGVVHPCHLGLQA